MKPITTRLQIHPPVLKWGGKNPRYSNVLSGAYSVYSTSNGRNPATTLRISGWIGYLGIRLVRWWGIWDRGSQLFWKLRTDLSCEWQTCSVACLKQVSQLSQRDRAAGLVNFSQKWKIIFYRKIYIYPQPLT